MVMSALSHRLFISSVLALCLIGCELIGNREESSCGCTVYEPLAGKWTDRNVSPAKTGNYQRLGFLPGNVYTDSIWKGDGNSAFVFQQDSGTWHADADTLFLEYRSTWMDTSGKKLGPSPKPIKIRQRFRLNDSGWLATTTADDTAFTPQQPMPAVWAYFRPADSLIRSRSIPYAGTTAWSSHDTDVTVGDTVRFVAVPGNPSKPPVRYEWSFDGGKRYLFASETGEMRSSWAKDEAGPHVVAVRGIDGSGQVSEPWYFEVRTHTCSGCLP